MINGSKQNVVLRNKTVFQMSSLLNMTCSLFIWDFILELQGYETEEI